jgi:predicted MFS family arabinose efflux permease
VLGFGVDSFTAAMPGVILAVTPKSETSSAMSFNYVVRSVGYSLGSATGGLVLATGTETGHLFPKDHAYTTAALVGIAAMAITALTATALARQRPPDPSSAASAPSQVRVSSNATHSTWWVIGNRSNARRSERW